MPISVIFEYCLDLPPDDPLMPFVETNLQFWVDCGLLGDVVDSGQHVTIVRRPQRAEADENTPARGEAVVIDPAEARTNRDLYERFGAFARLSRAGGKQFEVRSNLVLAYHFGEQLWRLLPKRMQDEVASSYLRCRESCSHSPEHEAELLEADEQSSSRHFITSHARRGPLEFFAECVSAYSIENSRDALEQFHPEMVPLIAKLTAGSLR